MRGKRIGNRIFAAGCVVALLIGMVTGCAQTKDTKETKQSDRPKIVMGGENYPPYIYEDTDGRPTGIDVDLAAEAFGRMGYEVVFSDIDWQEKKKLLEAGDIDCIWGCFSMDGREEDYNWAGPYMISRQVVAVKGSSGITSLADLEGKRVAVQSTTKPEEILCGHTDERIPQLEEIISLPNRELIYSFLSKGYVDAIAAHETSILQYMKDYDLQCRILDEPLQTVGLGVAFAKEDTRGLDQELSETLKEMLEDGTTEEILGRYLDDPKRYLEVDDYAK